MKEYEQKFDYTDEICKEAIRLMGIYSIDFGNALDVIRVSLLNLEELENNIRSFEKYKVNE